MLTLFYFQFQTNIIERWTANVLHWTFLISSEFFTYLVLTHWGRVTHICVSKLTIIGSDNSLSPDRRQAIIWTNAGILLIGILGTNFSEILSKIHTFSFKKMHWIMSSGRWRPFCLGLNVLIEDTSSLVRVKVRHRRMMESALCTDNYLHK